MVRSQHYQNKSSVELDHDIWNKKWFETSKKKKQNYKEMVLD
jgi:hypothetical protein